MATSRARRRQQQIRGIFPTLWHNLAIVFKWAFGHPKPIIIALFFSATCWGIVNFVNQSEAFKIKTVTVPADLSLDLPNLIGQNIWRVDLQSLSERLQRQRPDLKEIRVIRQLPNAIRVHAIARVAAAQVRLDRWHIVDTEGFILADGQAEPFDGLVRLTGFIRSETPLKLGKLNADERMKLALRVLPLVRQSPVLALRQLVELNVSDMQQIRFVLDGEVEIRCGSEAELEAHLARLQATMKLLARQPPLSIRYIDVRFPDPVVSPQQT